MGEVLWNFNQSYALATRVALSITLPRYRSCKTISYASKNVRKINCSSEQEESRKKLLSLWDIVGTTQEKLIPSSFGSSDCSLPWPFLRVLSLLKRCTRSRRHRFSYSHKNWISISDVVFCLCFHEKMEVLNKFLGKRGEKTLWNESGAKKKGRKTHFKKTHPYERSQWDVIEIRRIYGVDSKRKANMGLRNISWSGTVVKYQCRFVHVSYPCVFIQQLSEWDKIIYTFNSRPEWRWKHFWTKSK